MCCIPGRHVVRISPREDGGGGQCVKGPTKSNPTKKISPNLAHFSCHRAQFFSFFALIFCIFPHWGHFACPNVEGPSDTYWANSRAL